MLNITSTEDFSIHPRLRKAGPEDLFVSIKMASSSAQIFYLPTGCNCDNKTSYGQSEIKSAALEALSLASQKRTVGNDKYPHAYNDDEHFDFSHAQAPWSFPLRKLGHVIEEAQALTG